MNLEKLLHTCHVQEMDVILRRWISSGTHICRGGLIVWPARTPSISFKRFDLIASACLKLSIFLLPQISSFAPFSGLKVKYRTGILYAIQRITLLVKNIDPFTIIAVIKQYFSF